MALTGGVGLAIFLWISAIGFAAGLIAFMVVISKRHNIFKHILIQRWDIDGLGTSSVCNNGVLFKLENQIWGKWNLTALIGVFWGLAFLFFLCLGIAAWRPNMYNTNVYMRGRDPWKWFAKMGIMIVATIITSFAAGIRYSLLISTTIVLTVAQFLVPIGIETVLHQPLRVADHMSWIPSWGAVTSGCTVYWLLFLLKTSIILWWFVSLVRAYHQNKHRVNVTYSPLGYVLVISQITFEFIIGIMLLTQSGVRRPYAGFHISYLVIFWIFVVLYGIVAGIALLENYISLRGGKHHGDSKKWSPLFTTLYKATPRPVKCQNKANACNVANCQEHNNKGKNCKPNNNNNNRGHSDEGSVVSGGRS